MSCDKRKCGMEEGGARMRVTFSSGAQDTGDILADSLVLHPCQQALLCPVHYVTARLIGPYILPPRLTGPRYLIFLQEVLEFLEDVRLDIWKEMWFQHDGAPAHFEVRVRNPSQRRVFGVSWWIDRGGPHAWPQRSPDLTSLDFFLRDYMKSPDIEELVDMDEARYVKTFLNSQIFLRGC
ncbi:PREDICTED: uncharacterized protein LOC105451681 [Wasmannia auropunctata]|uniref:uncharacterized protein LOC105451681 n=1 Tax=Wasmannia auropunctata TaxID=64793 RepID=UPI0005EF9F41|nr:PREDICTED: uncharacterized protein LOC105451681 [Wasmannia auropunctata]